VEQIREMPLEDMRRQTEEKFGQPMAVIGCDTISHAQVEALLTEALR
jgi:hypothetical protein